MLVSTVLTLALGSLGALAAVWIGAPAPYLTGPALVVSVAGVAGLRCGLPAVFREGCFLLVGLGLGAGVTPEVLADAARWPVSLIAMVLAITAMMFGGALLLRRGFGCDPRTALLAATPGHMSFVLGLSLDTGGDVGRIAVIQALRVLLLTLLVPAVVALVPHDGPPAATGAQPALSAPLFLLLLLGAVLLGRGFQWLKVPAAYLLAGMVLSTLGHAGDLTPGRVPPALSVAAFVTMGTIIGTRFTGITPRQILSAGLAAATLTAGGFAFAALVSLTVVRLTGLPFKDVLIALVPGGLETMIAIAGVLGGDSTFVGLHHIARIFLLSALVPLALARLPRPAEGAAEP